MGCKRCDVRTPPPSVRLPLSDDEDAKKICCKKTPSKSVELLVVTRHSALPLFLGVGHTMMKRSSAAAQRVCAHCSSRLRLPLFLCRCFFLSCSKVHPAHAKSLSHRISATKMGEKRSRDSETPYQFAPPPPRPLAMDSGSKVNTGESLPTLTNWGGGQREGKVLSNARLNSHQRSTVQRSVCTYFLENKFDPCISSSAPLVVLVHSRSHSQMS